MTSAHDFNNLLTVLIGNVDLALAELDESDPMWAMVTAIGEKVELRSETRGTGLGLAIDSTRIGLYLLQWGYVFFDACGRGSHVRRVADRDRGRWQ